jgi:hypothetical protein
MIGGRDCARKRAAHAWSISRNRCHISRNSCAAAPVIRRQDFIDNPIICIDRCSHRDHLPHLRPSAPVRGSHRAHSKLHRAHEGGGSARAPPRSRQARPSPAPGPRSASHLHHARPGGRRTPGSPRDGHSRSPWRHRQRLHDLSVARPLRGGGEAPARAAGRRGARGRLPGPCYRACYHPPKGAEPLAKTCDPTGNPAKVHLELPVALVVVRPAS